MASPREILDSIVEMIEDDIDGMKQIMAESGDGRVDARSAAKLTRYSKAMLEVLDYEASVRKEQKRKLSSLSKEELEDLAKAALGKS